MRFDDAGNVLDAGQEFFQRAGVFGDDFQRVIEISGDVVAFLDLRFVADEVGESVAVLRAVEAQEHQRHQVLVQHGGIEDGRVLTDYAGRFEFFQPFADSGDGERCFAAEIGQRGARVFLKLMKNFSVNGVHDFTPPFNNGIIDYLTKTGNHFPIFITSL